MFRRLLDRFDSEPVMVLFALRTIVLAGISFGVNMTIEQFGAMMIALEAVAAVFTRGKVTPNTNVESTKDGSI
jgi:hypothetical protein